MFDGLAAPSHWIILLVLFVVFFGYKKLPDASKNMARSLRIFKSEMKGFHEDETPANPATQNAAPHQLPAAPAPVAAPTAPPTPEAPVSAAVEAAPQPVATQSPVEHVAAGDGAAPRS